MNKQELILVTGASGFLGTYLTRLLLERGYRVRALRRLNSDTGHLQGYGDKIEWVNTDLTDLHGLDEAFAGVDVVGGDDKSYYVQVGSEIGFRLFKKNYDEEFARMFKDCPSFSEKIKNPTWSDLEKNIYDYTKECK